HAAHDHVGDAALFEEVVDFLAAVGDGVAVDDFDGRVLALPGAIVFALGVVVAAAVGIVDGKFAFFFKLDKSPFAYFVGGRRGRGALGQFSARRSLIGFHRVAGGVDDETAPGPHGVDQLINSWRNYAAALCRAFAP